MPREKSRYRVRRSSSSNSESSYDRKKKSKHKRRSRSRDRSVSSSHRRKRSTSRSKPKRRSNSRSLSRDRYEKSRRRSTSRSRSKRDNSHSRSSSRSKSKHTKSSKKARRKSRSSSSRSSSYEGKGDLNSEDLSSVMDALRKLNLRRGPLLTAYYARRQTTSKVNLDDTDIKIERAIKAAAAAGLTMTKIPTYEYKEVEIKEDMPTIHDRNLLEELNSESFVQKAFVSSTQKKASKNIVIDLNNDNQTILTPEVDIVKKDDESIIDLAQIPCEEELMEMWIKKLYTFRKRMLKGEI